MFRFIISVLVIAAGLVGGFFFVPREEVEPTRVLETVYPATEQARAYFISTRQPGSAPSPTDRTVTESPAADGAPKVVRTTKSEFRKAVEGRLKWLGVTEEIVIPKTCVTDQLGNRVCGRWL